MGYSNQFFRGLGVNPSKRTDINKLSEKTGIPTSRLHYYNDNNIIPSGLDMTSLENSLGIYELDLKIKMGRIDHNVIEYLQEHADDVISLISDRKQAHHKALEEYLAPVFKTELGVLYNLDCLKALKTVESDSVDLVFADPPFNLGKLYPSNMDDNLKTEEYLKWTEAWLSECIRTLKPGGSLFTWNLPVWNSQISYFLHGRMTFKHWIATDIKYNLPIKGRLYPSHYSLLYFVKGKKANVYKPDRLPTPTCPSCYFTLKDYGGYKHKMNPLGVSLTDVWNDIPPVRHAKHKKRKGSNELPIKLIDRIIEMASGPGDLILDPFGGAGTTYIVAELKSRRWWGCEIDPCDVIIERFNKIGDDCEYLKEVRSSLNNLFPPFVKFERERRGLWTAESVAYKNDKEQKNIELLLFDEKNT